MGGSGRADMSGNGFAEWNELGVEVTRWDGGHSRSGGSSSFSLLPDAGMSVEEDNFSLSLERPRLKRLKSAFMVVGRRRQTTLLVHRRDWTLVRRTRRSGGLSTSLSAAKAW